VSHKAIFQVVFFFLLTYPSIAQVEFESGKDIYHVNEFVNVFTTTDTLSGQSAWTGIKNNQLKELTETTNPGMTNSAFWIQIEITNNHAETEFYLEVDYAQLDYLQLFEIVNDSARLLSETGDRYVFNELLLP